METALYTSTRNIIPILVTIFIVFINAVCFIFISIGQPFTSPLSFSAFRTLLGGLTIFLALPLLRQPMWPSSTMWKWIFALVLPSTIIAYSAMFFSATWTDIGVASVLGNLQPLLTILLAAFILREKITWKIALSLTLGIGGVIVLVSPSIFHSFSYGYIGITLALVASIAAASSNIIVKRIKSIESILTISAWQLILGSVALGVLSIFFEKDAIVWNSSFLLSLGFLGIIGTGLTTALWYNLIQKNPVGRLSLLFFLVPIFGLVATKLQTGIKFQAFEFLGALLIIASMAVSFLNYPDFGRKIP